MPVTANKWLILRRHDKDKAMVLHALFPEKDSLKQHAMWFASAVKEKIEEKSWRSVLFGWRL